MTRSLLLAALLLPALASFALAEPLGLKQLEHMALERNLNLRSELFKTRASAARERQGYGIYDPLLSFSLVEGEDRDLFNSQFFSGENGQEFRLFDLSLTQKMPSGADLSLQFGNLRQRVFTPPSPQINPVYRSELRFTLIQPLLRNFGRTVTEQERLFAGKDREVSVQDLREAAFRLLGEVRDAYFDALRHRDNLAYREASVALAAKVLEENRRRLEAGVLPPVEVLEAEVGLKSRERELLDARRVHQDSLDNLSLLVRSDAQVELDGAPLGQPELTTDEEDGRRAALEKRPDVLRRSREIEKLDLQRQVARNQLLPALDLTASYAHKGLAEDYDGDLDLLASEELRSWEVGLAFSLPLGNRAARHAFIETQQRLKGGHALLAQLRNEVGREIRAAIRLLEVSRKKVEVTLRGRELADEKLRILLRRKEVGLATTREVLEGEEDLAAARTDQVAALADYNKAVTAYLKATGELFEHEGVHFSPSLELDEE